MIVTAAEVAAVEADVVPTDYGKFLAVAQAHSAIRFAVIGDTREEAIALFEREREAWRLLVAPDSAEAVGT